MQHDPQMAQMTADVEKERNDPVPARFWWLKRGIAALGLCAVAVVLSYLWLNHVADRQFQAVIDAARSRGEPALPEDFDAAPVADAQNAGLSLSNAEVAISHNTAFQNLDYNYQEGSLTPSQLDLIKTDLATNAKSLALARRARSQPGLDWGLKFRTPVFAVLLPYLAAQRNLSGVLGWSARYNHAIGNDREAIETIRDMLFQAQAVQRGPTCLVIHLVSEGIQARVYNSLEEIAPDLRIEGGKTATEPAEAATRRQVRDLIDQLCNDEPFRREAIRAWQGERMAMLDGFRYQAIGGMMGVGMVNSPSVLPKWAIELDGVRSAHNIAAVFTAVAQPNRPAALAKLPQEPHRSRESNLEEISRLLSQILEPSFPRAVEQDFRALVERRAAALRLAIRGWRVDHDGQYPARLDDLVPKYIPQVPVDPYAADGRPMSYRAGPPFPAMWSVGENGVDDGGTSVPGPSGTPLKWECADIVFPLSLQVPTTQGSATTQGN